MQIFTIGHSTRSINELIHILSSHSVTALVDVRSFPRSFKNPQFNIDVIKTVLSKHHIRYVWQQKLGGRRKGLGKKSENKCWKGRAFRNYADYMETSAFREGLEELIQLGNKGTVTIMCAEVLYWRCHRSMISDSLRSKGILVTHILSERYTREHEYTQCAKIMNGQLTYR